MRFFKLLFFVCLSFVSGSLFGAEKIRIVHDSVSREAFVCKPDSAKPSSLLPVLMIFHGGGGTSRGTMRNSSFPALSQTEQFIAVFPNALNKNWNDMRTGNFSESHKKKLDDVGFVSKLIDLLVKDYAADPKRIYVTGISNGGIFSQTLALKLGSKIAGAASVCAQIPEGMNDLSSRPDPMSVMFMNGTKDPLVPYHGGDVVVNLMPGLNKLLGRKPKSRGRVTSTQESLDFWLEVNGIVAKPKITEFEDKAKDDGIRATKVLWQKGNLAVCLIRLDGGGHTIPGGKQYISERIIGKVARDIDGEKEIWEFLKQFSNQSLTATVIAK